MMHQWESKPSDAKNIWLQSLPAFKMADVFYLPNSKMAANRMVAKYNVEAKFTSVTAIRPRYVT